ncbi:MAG TPA: 3-hydroxyacyl-CoA dehydrogenase [Nevskiaceae bacterium]|nr:3-hydroxyacyl-CoA dehydrogenase [Nevskiaceae bacterium]
MRIEKHTFLVTGGASGLGAATARLIAKGGGNVVIADVNEVGGHAVLAELGAAARYARVDVTEGAEVQAAVELATSAFGKLHGVICCAGIATPAKVLSKEGPQPLEQFERIVAINLVGTFNVIRLAAQVMSKQDPNEDGERGVIVNTASIAAFDGQIGQAGYAASKAGIAGMTLPVARELARFGIRVVTIAPGLFETPLTAGLPEEAQVSLGKSIPFPSRLGRPAEFAQLVQSIVENPMLNGETIRLDGALRMAPK